MPAHFYSVGLVLDECEPFVFYNFPTPVLDYEPWHARPIEESIAVGLVFRIPHLYGSVDVLGWVACVTFCELALELHTAIGTELVFPTKS
jgi:hypothetical protein